MLLIPIIEVEKSKPGFVVVDVLHQKFVNNKRPELVRYTRDKRQHRLPSARYCQLSANPPGRTWTIANNGIAWVPISIILVIQKPFFAAVHSQLSNFFVSRIEGVRRQPFKHLVQFLVLPPCLNSATSNGGYNGLASLKCSERFFVSPWNLVRFTI